MAIMAQTKHEPRPNLKHAASPDGREEGDREVKFEEDAQGTSPEEDDMRRDTADAENGDGQHAASPNSDSPARKRRRSRKGLDKKFDCTFEGCGKSYSRAEHLYRHQLNHSAKIVFTCSFKGCGKTFVRLDLRSRHEERHTARGSAIGRRDSIVGQSPINDRPHTGIPHAQGSLSPESSRPATGFPSIPVLRPSAPYQSPQGSVSSPYTPITNTPPAAYAANLVANGGYTDGYSHLASHQAAQVRRHSLAHSVAHVANIPPPQPPIAPPPPPQYDVVASAPAYTPQTAAQAVSYVAQQAGMPVSLPSSTYINSQVTPFSRAGGQPYAPPTTTAAGYHEEVANQSSEMMMLDQMSIQATVPVFGTDGLSNKSPYAIPDDFVVFLFNPPGSDLQRMDSMVQYQSGYDDYQARYGAPYFPNDGLPPNYYASASHEIMAVNNLLDQNTPEATISEEKSQEIYDFIKERFQERNRPPVEKRRDCVLEGDRADPDHFLSKRMMQAYIGAYWLHFSDQVPILHKPTFSPDKTPTLLLIAMMAIGAACLDRGKETAHVRAGALVSNFLAWSLRFEVFMDDNFAPPSKLWIFQALILLELYEKMFTTREMHERAHIHHATTITLMRRGRSLIGKSALESPPNPRSESSATGSNMGNSTTPDDWWNSWIANESTRRTAFAAFVVDSLHGTMFGHSTVMVAHEMRLPLPCDDSLWNATSAGDVVRLETKIATDNLKPVSFLEGLKCTLNNQEVHTNSFGRTVLMAGLLSVAWHMHQRDLQINVLGSGVLAAGGRDSWRSAITRAFDHWKMDYDKALRRAEPTRDPYRLNETRRTDDKQVFESRIVLLHLAHMATHADIVECQMFARAKRLLGRAISQPDLQNVQKRMRGTWAPSPRGRNAAFYALKYLFTVLMPEGTGGAPQPGYELNMPYSARDDLLLNRPWVLYYAALVLWSYGHALEGPSPDAPLPSTQQEMVADMRQYLLQYATASSPDDLMHKGGISKNSAVLMVLRETFKLTRWELLHEAANLLNNCITLNAGGSIH
jgi:ribosomal protein S9